MELRKAIQSGEYPPGSQLPSEAELISLLGVSRTTIREALRSLEEGGLVIRRHGVGTFVLERPIVNNFGIIITPDEMIRMSNQVPGIMNQSIQEGSATLEVATQLGIEPDSPVYQIERIHTANGNPIVFSIDYLPITLLGGGKITEEALIDRTLFDLLMEEYNLSVEFGIARIKPIHASDEIGRKLNQKRNEVLILITQTNFLSNDRPVMYSMEYHLPNVFNYMFLRRRLIKS